MQRNDRNLLGTARFCELTKWSVYMPVFKNRPTEYSFVPLSKMLKRKKEPVTIEEHRLYRRITVRLYGQGVLLRDQIEGSGIKTKRQFAAHEGQLILSRIDARNGAVGIVPKELEGAIVTNDFWLFDICGVQAQYLMMILSSLPFQQYWQTLSSGTTNRQRVSEDGFLSSKIPLPREDVRSELIRKYNAKIKQACSFETEADKIEKEMDGDLYHFLGIQKEREIKKEALLTAVAFKDTLQWGYDKLAVPFPFSFKTYKAYSFGTKPSWMKEIFRGKSPQYDAHSADIILNQKCNRMDQIDLSFAKRVNGEWLNQIENKFLTREGDILINSTGEGTLGRASLVTKEAVGMAYDSHMLLLRVNTKEVNPQLIVDLINSSFGQRQVELFKSAQATKQTELGIENAKRILFPLPPLPVQNKITGILQRKKKRMRMLREKAKKQRQCAKDEFERAVFGPQ